MNFRALCESLWRLLLALVWAGLLVQAPNSLAHEVRPAYLEINERAMMDRRAATELPPY